MQNIKAAFTWYTLFPAAGGLGVLLVEWLLPYANVDIPQNIARFLVGLGIFLILVSFIGVILKIFVCKKPNDANLISIESKKAEAHTIHQRIIELDKQLWEIKDGLLRNKDISDEYDEDDEDDEDLRDNPDIKRVLDELLNELNKLRQLINNRGFDDYTDDIFKAYSEMLMFPKYNIHSGSGMLLRNRINTNINWYIDHKVKG